MSFHDRRAQLGSLAVVALAAVGLSSCASPTGASDGSPGITDSEVTIGISAPQSGPNAAYGQMAAGAEACFAYLNEEQGGVEFADGTTRTFDVIVYDDAMEPARNLQNARRLISQDQVFLVSGSPGSGANMGSREYYNSEEVPQVFIGSGAPEFGDEAEEFPWSMLGQPAYNTEAAIYANFIAETWPDAKIGLLNDDSGGPYFADGFLKAADELGLDIISHQEYSNAETTIDAKIDALKKAGVDVFVNASTPKFAVQSLTRVKDLNWDVNHVLWYVGSSVGGVLQPAGSAAAKGVYSALWLKDYSNPQFADDEDVQLYAEKIAEYGSGLEPADMNVVQGWYACNALALVLAESEPTRESVMEQLRHMEGIEAPMLMDGITLNTDGTEDGFPVESLQMAQYNGQSFDLLGEIIDYEGETPAR
jgi:branched-chain amino acid transport system substrate-binding protein